jgi:hypothetical protein
MNSDDESGRWASAYLEWMDLEVPPTLAAWPGADLPALEVSGVPIAEALLAWEQTLDGLMAEMHALSARVQAGSPGSSMSLRSS